VTAPFWRLPARRYQAPPPRRVDCLIVGGGITGVSLLHWLIGCGVGTALVERSRLAAGASGRNAGFLLAGVAANYQQAVRLFGRGWAGEIWSFTSENHALLREVLMPRDAGYLRRGSLVLAGSDAEAEQLQASAALLQEDGFDARWLAAEKGLLNPADGELNPARAVAEVASAVADRVSEGVDVTGLQQGGDVVIVDTSAGELQAGVVVLATNAYTSRLVPEVGIRPVRGQMLATLPLNREVAARPIYSHHGFRYWRQLPDGHLLVGGYRDMALAEEIGYEETPTDRIQEHLDAHLRGAGITARVSHRWAGIMGFTEDGLPLIGSVPGWKNLYICGGYSGHGMAFAFHAARSLAEHLTRGAQLPAWTRRRAQKVATA
jgi:gamma-glutamylputrescine oxidase